MIIEVDLTNYRDVLKDKSKQQMYLKYVVNGFGLDKLGTMLYNKEKDQFELNKYMEMMK